LDSGCIAHGVLLGLRVIVFNREEARRVYGLGFYGKPLGVAKPRGADFDAPLELGLMEAVYLAEQGLLCVEKPGGHRLHVEELREYARRSIERFDELYTVYRDLRDHGYVVRSGLKYGVDFAVYERGPGLEHAPFLVHVLRRSDSVDPLYIVRASRLSHSVRKEFIIAAVGAGGSVSYLVFEWSKP